MTGNRVKCHKDKTVPRFTVRAAVPEGGDLGLNWRRVRDCLYFAALALLPLDAKSQTVPSGQSVTLTEVLEDAVGGEDWLRMRFVAPQIARDGGTVSHEAAAADFIHLCDDVALPYLVEFSLAPDVVVISLMDRAVEFGATDPDATQFFEAFRIVDDTCVLDAF